MYNVIITIILPCDNAEFSGKVTDGSTDTPVLLGITASTRDTHRHVGMQGPRSGIGGRSSLGYLGSVIPGAGMSVCEKE